MGHHVSASLQCSDLKAQRNLWGVLPDSTKYEVDWRVFWTSTGLVHRNLATVCASIYQKRVSLYYSSMFDEAAIYRLAGLKSKLSSS